MIGEIINDRYRLDAVLGHGGMGAVYRGYDLQLERDVAIKLLNQVVFIQDERNRLLHEAKLIARLRHPNIVSVFDVGDFDGAPFFVMEYVGGGSLREHPKHDPEDLNRIITQICQGLACAHDQGIIHRDLKPENVLLENEGRVKLADFGIARSDATRFTSEQQVTGTAHYMAPEVIKGEAVDSRSDLYSLGVIMYELNTGQLPFQADTLMGLINKHLFEEVIPPVEYNPDLPTRINELILRLLSKTPGERPSSAREVQKILESGTAARVQAGTLSAVQSHRTAENSRHNLKIQPSSFIGRENDLIQIRNYLGDPDCRLLTLVGIGGIGKTRLANRAAYDVINNYEDGVWMVELASLSEADLLPQKVALLFGVSAQEAREGSNETDVLVDYLKEKNLLLVMDNCEHLIDACAQFAETMLEGCSRVKLLATSREGLRIPGEILFHVPPMELAPDHTSPENLETFGAIRLFTARAGANLRTFEITKENGPAITQICRRLDGIPLAIELAAARIKVLSPDQIAGRLEHRFQLLIGGSRTALPRHQTLEAAIDWSYDLLTEQEQLLLRRLAVFSGGWTLESAENVIKLAPEDERTLFDLLSQLVDKSLVLVDEGENIRRYWFLETVRQYGINKLKQEGEIRQARQDHLDYFLKLAEHTDEGLRTEQQTNCLAVLDAEHDNLRAALRWSLNEQSPELAFRIVAALGWYWFMRGFWYESSEWMYQCLALEAESAPLIRARAIYKAGGLDIIRGRVAGRVELVEEALQVCRDEGYQEGIAWCLNLLGQVGTWGQAEADISEKYLSESIEIFNQIGNKWGAAWSTRYLGQIVEISGDFDKSIQLQKEALASFDQVGDNWNCAHSLYLMGGSYFLSGHHDEARLAYEESLEKCKLVEDRVMEAHAVRGLAVLALQLGELDEAEQRFSEALEALQKIGDENCSARVLQGQGELYLVQGEYVTSAEKFRDSLSYFQALGNEIPICTVLIKVAALAETIGNYQDAVRLLAYAEKKAGDLIVTTPAINEEHQQLVTAARASLGRDKFNLHWFEGEQMKLDTAVDIAMDLKVD